MKRTTRFKRRFVIAPTGDFWLSTATALALLLFSGSALGQSKKDTDVKNTPVPPKAVQKSPIAKPIRRSLQIQVTYIDKKPIPGLVITSAGDSNQAETNEAGKAKLTLRTRTAADEPITFSIVKMPPGTNLRFVSPWDASMIIPSVAKSSGFVAEIMLIEFGDRVALENYTVLRNLGNAIIGASRLDSNLGKTVGDPIGATPQDAINYRLETEVRSRGWTPEEATAALIKRGETSHDPYDRAIGAFLKGDFSEARKQLLLSNIQFTEAVKEESFKRASFLGKIYYAEGDYENASTAFIDANTYQSDNVENLNDLALTRAVLGDMKGAFRYVLRAKEIAIREGNQESELFESINMLGGLELEKRNYDQAVTYFQEATDLVNSLIKIKRRPDLVEKRSRAINSIGTVYFLTGRLKDAESIFDEAIKTLHAENGVDTDDVVAILPSLAVLYAVTERKPDGIKLLLKALSISERRFGPEHPQLFNTLNNLGGGLTDLREFEKARAYLARGLKLKTGSLKRAILLTTLGNSYMRERKFSEAETPLREATEIYKTSRLPETFFESNAFTWLGGSLFLQKKYTEALSEWKRALDVRTKVLKSDSPYLAQSHNNYARGLAFTKHPKEAEHHFKEAIRILGNLENADAAKTLENYAEFLTDQKRPDEAAVWSDRAKQMRKRLEEKAPATLYRRIPG